MPNVHKSKDEHGRIIASKIEGELFVCHNCDVVAITVYSCQECNEWNCRRCACDYCNKCKMCIEGDSMPLDCGCGERERDIQYQSDMAKRVEDAAP